jgi:hypothetical protein
LQEISMETGKTVISTQLRISYPLPITNLEVLESFDINTGFLSFFLPSFLHVPFKKQLCFGSVSYLEWQVYQKVLFVPIAKFCPSWLLGCWIVDYTEMLIILV